ncbi:MAG: histidinol dehydrogenase [Firmicutes bacterium]|nr:histidinol dehydrogenase [Bacillota bacterium]
MIQIFKYGEVDNSEIFARVEPAVNVEDIVTSIIEDVKKNKDAALKAYCKKFDGADIDDLEVSEQEIQEAFNAVDPEFLDILREAAVNISEFHKKQVRNNFVLTRKDGVVMGQRVLPIEKAGLYVPGGTAAYPSTVLMDSIPAKIAGCSEIVIVTPPGKDGKINPVILAAAKIAGVDRIFKVGGAQAVAALAYGTETIPKVDKIVGPGNAFVAEAKKQVFGRVSIDMIAGPSEILVVADETCNPAYLAADLLSQAEHDKLASAVLVTNSMELAEKVRDELEIQIPLLPRKDIARESIDKNGKIIVADDLMQAIDISNEIAPEHLELCMDDPFEYLDNVKHAGSIFMGKYCPEALGDYFSGANHTLPTSGTARFSSPLSVDDFVKKSQFTYYTKKALRKDAEKIAYFAEKEGLSAHARSALIRYEGEDHE